MILDFTEKGKVKVNMAEYVKKILEEFPEEIGKMVATPASNMIFQVRKEKDRKKLCKEEAQIFHTTVAQCLFLSAHLM